MSEKKQSGEHWDVILKRGEKPMLFVMVLLLCLILLSSCAPSGPARGVEFCSVAKPIYVTEEDVPTPALARDLLAHNQIGQHFCGWRPREN